MYLLLREDLRLRLLEGDIRMLSIEEAGDCGDMSLLDSSMEYWWATLKKALSYV